MAMKLITTREDYEKFRASPAARQKRLLINCGFLRSAWPAWAEICNFETAQADPRQLAQFFGEILSGHGLYPAFFFVAEKNPGEDIPTEGFFYPAGYAGACPAIRVQRVAVKHKNKADTYSLFTEAGILRIGKMQRFDIHWQVGHTGQLRWSRDLILKALDTFNGEGKLAGDFMSFGSFENDHEERVRLGILLHRYNWLVQDASLDICAADLKQYGLGIQNPIKQKKPESDILNFERSHIKNFIDRMKIRGMNDLTRAAEVLTQTELTKKQGAPKLQKEDVKHPKSEKRSEQKPSVKEPKLKKKPAKHSKASRR